MKVLTWLSGRETLKQLEFGEVTSLDGLIGLIPGGAYTTLRTFNGSQTLLLEDHFQRLEETSSLAGTPLQLDRSKIRQALRQVIRQSREVLLAGSASTQAIDFRLRLTLDLEQNPGDLYISSQQLQTPPAEAYLQGARAITTRMQRLNPKAKLTRFIQRSGAVRQAIPASVNEAVMYDEESNLLEGLSSNFYAVIDGAIWTAEEGVLSGITRSMVIECARRLEIPLVFRPARLAEIPAMQEAFITSASRAVLPLSYLDAFRLPAAPGEITRRLMQEYAVFLQEKLAEI